MMFLSATRSMMLVAFWNTSLAAGLSPAVTAWRTRLIAVRSIERRLELWRLRSTDWRARLRACAVLAMAYVLVNSAKSDSLTSFRGIASVWKVVGRRPRAGSATFTTFSVAPLRAGLGPRRNRQSGIRIAAGRRNTPYHTPEACRKGREDGFAVGCASLSNQRSGRQ
jgi:hypothetical protein